MKVFQVNLISSPVTNISSSAQEAENATFDEAVLSPYVTVSVSFAPFSGTF